MPPIRHLLLGMNAHINYDLPQALLEVITDQEFDDRELIAHGRATTRTSTRSSPSACPRRTGSCRRPSSRATGRSWTGRSRPTTAPARSGS